MDAKSMDGHIFRTDRVIFHFMQSLRANLTFSLNVFMSKSFLKSVESFTNAYKFRQGMCG